MVAKKRTKKAKKKSTTPKKTSLKVQNIVATTSLGKPISLTKLAKTLVNTTYNPDQFPGVILRTKISSASILLRKSRMHRNQEHTTSKTSHRLSD